MTDNYIVFNQEISAGYLHAIRTTDTQPSREVAVLHCHDRIFEIIMLLTGTIEFHVEGSVYKPNPFDMIIVRPNELHKIIAYGDEPYERFTLHIASDYFIKNNCERFKSIFLNRKLGSDNLIPASVVKKQMYNSFLCIENFFENEEYIVANAAILQFLYHLNSYKKDTLRPAIKNQRINEIILFMNENMSEPITLESLSEHFYIDKYYLCKAFKKNTGYTINQYLTYKRVLLAREFHNQGMSLTESCSNAGFNSYSNFYKAHIKYFGSSPKGTIS